MRPIRTEKKGPIACSFKRGHGSGPPLAWRAALDAGYPGACLPTRQQVNVAGRCDCAFLVGSADMARPLDNIKLKGGINSCHRHWQHFLRSFSTFVFYVARQTTAPQSTPGAFLYIFFQFSLALHSFTMGCRGNCYTLENDGACLVDHSGLSSRGMTWYFCPLHRVYHAIRATRPARQPFCGECAVLFFSKLPGAA